MIAEPAATVDFGAYLAPSRGPRRARWASAHEAVRQLPNGARVFVAPAAVMPMALLEALDEERTRWSRLELVMGYAVARPAPFRHPGAPFRFVTTQATRAFRHLWDTGFADRVPCRYADHAGLYVPGAPLACDAALIQVSSPRADGRVSLGPSVGSIIDVTRAAPLVIAQVNPHIPYTRGAGELTTEEIDYLVPVDQPLVGSPSTEPVDALARRIAGHAAAVIPEEATLQFGVGALPDAVLAALAGRRGLRVHSGLLTEACIDLVEAGAIEAPIVAAEVVTTPRLLAWVADNPALQMGPAGYTHGAGVLASLDRFVAINSAVEVALDGSANSEVAGEEVISGPGGAPDYAFGASIGNGGRSIVALRSTAARGSLSRIVATIAPPRPVTLPAYLADAVVTEHGVAEVRGMPLGARRDAIRALAAPEHRSAL